MATFLAAAGGVAFSYFTAPWGVFGFPVRYTIAALFLAATIFSLRRVRAEDDTSRESPFRPLIKIILAFVFGGVALGVLRAHDVPPGAIDLGFPLRDGSFVVGHGGSTPAANTYSFDAAQKYAVDVMKLNAAGMRARGFFPSDPRAYAIFGAPVLSPCAGAVKTVAKDSVVLRCGDADVTIAHLQNIGVKPGAQVPRGAAIARIGEAGNDIEPHLHVFATRNGVAVPARFDGRWLVRNDIVRKR